MDSRRWRRGDDRHHGLRAARTWRRGFCGVTEAGRSFGTVESVKAVSEIYAPASGEVVEANVALNDAPEKINSDPHGAAWLIKIRLANPAELSALMKASYAAASIK